MDYLNIIVKTLDRFVQNFIALIPNILVAIFFSVITYFVAKLVGRLVSALLPRMAVRANLVTISHKLTIILV